MTPVHKGGDTLDPGNFYPISVVPVVTKILEKVTVTQLTGVNLLWPIMYADMRV